MRPLDGGVVRRVEEAAFSVDLLPPGAPGSNSLGPEDRTALEEAARVAGASVILVDHYGASERYMEGLRGEGLGLAVIDDTAARDLSSADWVLNQNLGADRLPLSHRPGATVLLGPSYALLRPEFARAREWMSRSFSAADVRVLVTLGGGDVASQANRVLEALEAVPGALEVRVVARTNMHVPAHSRHRVELVHNPADMAAEMAWADLSVNAGGSTCWELACLGVPMLVLVLSPDQQGVAVALEQEGAAVQVQGSAPDRLAETVASLLADAGRRRAMSSSAAALVDGLGAQRAARSLVETFGKRRGS
jgi:spore coat polysaccharide biosynthesis predicted glycosyltransferase SpsG